MHVLMRSMVLLLAGMALLSAPGCRKSPKPQTTTRDSAPSTPTVRLTVMSTMAGALEPCGCHKNMLGGLDHAAAYIEKAREEVPNFLLLAAGPTFYLNPKLEGQSEIQDRWKAESIAAGLKDVGLTAFAPGANDFAGGVADFAKLVASSGATPLAANVTSQNVTGPNGAAPNGSGQDGLGQNGFGQHAGLAPTRVVEVGPHKVGLVGVSALQGPGGAHLPKDTGFEVNADLAAALKQGVAGLKQAGAQILVGLVSAQRGQALRIAEAAPELDVLVIGKSFDQGDGNDAPKAPELLGKTLVVEAPNHLQAVSTIDLFVDGDDFEFSDATGIEQARARLGLEGRIAELEKRIASWKEAGKANAEDIAARQKDLTGLQAQLANLPSAVAPPKGSYFRYELQQVAESLGESQRVRQRMLEYYKRVNQHNKQAFAERKPPQLAKGAAGYVGVNACVECHQDAVTFWRGTGHGSAYKTLEDDFKEFNLDCVSCHVTGYEQPGGSTVTFVENLKDVQCEECHGPGSKHAEEEDTDLITLDPGKEFCKKCHHAPHVASTWSADEAWPHILGPGHGEPMPEPGQQSGGGQGGASTAGAAGQANAGSLGRAGSSAVKP